jgi:hypothetical protein
MTVVHVRHGLKIERPSDLEAEPIEAPEPESAMARAVTWRPGCGGASRKGAPPSVRYRAKRPTTSRTVGLRLSVFELNARLHAELAKCLAEVVLDSVPAQQQLGRDRLRCVCVELVPSASRDVTVCVWAFKCDSPWARSR